jgi:hypothetical protein
LDVAEGDEQFAGNLFGDEIALVDFISECTRADAAIGECKSRGNIETQRRLRPNRFRRCDAARLGLAPRLGWRPIR